MPSKYYCTHDIGRANWTTNVLMSNDWTIKLSCAWTTKLPYCACEWTCVDADVGSRADADRSGAEHGDDGVELREGHRVAHSALHLRGYIGYGS